jgi:hypothetical protein
MLRMRLSWSSFKKFTLTGPDVSRGLDAIKPNPLRQNHWTLQFLFKVFFSCEAFWKWACKRLGTDVLGPYRSVALSVNMWPGHYTWNYKCIKESYVQYALAKFSKELRSYYHLMQCHRTEIALDCITFIFIHVPFVCGYRDNKESRIVIARLFP